MDGFEVRRIAPGDTLGLRHQVLRPHQAPEELVYPGDLDPLSLHVGAFVEGRLVGVGSVLARPMPDALAAALAGAGAGTAPGVAGSAGGSASMGASAAIGAVRPWQLRGMAVLPEFRRRRVGEAMLEACIRHVAAQGSGIIWCNARTGALSLYRRAGFETSGGEFQVPNAGPHYVMWRTVAPAR